MRVLIAAALIAPLLSGCVIYANESGEKDVVVRFGDQASPSLETVRGARIENDRLIVRVDSNGCTDAADFAVDLTPANGWTEVTLRRTDEDLCKALVPDGVEVSWALTDLGLEAGEQARLVNPTRL